MKKVLVFLLCSFMLVSCSSRKQGTVELDSVFEDEPITSQSILPTESSVEDVDSETVQASTEPTANPVYETNDDVPCTIQPSKATSTPSTPVEETEKSVAPKKNSCAGIKKSTC